ncbi:DUF2268 domain-containing putative Zn-dependent protease [Spirosoma oryzicola]|uniref:DUF2268 domain-containing putative Zn-dependent protease n=1 Tax=Spirosoma oryzicola TaxID=2898794 RepID=UPI001E39514C|nr:DUF2268 domain-containing putative Zn-dependent protease [Spirosoma oryzicola]UHG94770.1 DUF2268 domain-containing protein [Spirosoma oryzicola]
MIKLIGIALCFVCLTSFAQQNPSITNQKPISFDGRGELNYDLPLKQNNVYRIKVYQEDIDVEVNLYDTSRQKVCSTDLADGNKGYDQLEYVAQQSGLYRLNIKSVSPKPVPTGLIKIEVTTLSEAQIRRRQQIAQELAVENTKAVTTIDVQHFWEAYDRLKQCRTYVDSVEVIQAHYLDRATNGLKEFQRVRYLAAEFYIERIKKYRRFYASVRENTMLFLNPAELSAVIAKTRSLYEKGTPAKIAITIGPMSSGGTLSNQYVLIGLEMLAGDKNCDVSEITNENLKSDILVRSGQRDVLNFVKETIAHEYIHTQQKAISKDACQCVLLEQVLKEGVASFMAESLVMERTQEITSRAAVYATKNEKQLWQAIKNELCSTSVKNWLFNAATSKERPGDLGYRMGYKIAQAYYNQSVDKNAAIREMIELDNALMFLDKSGYDRKFR